MNFKNKKVVITGGSTGIGLATAKAFIYAGASVLITGRNEVKLKAAYDEVGSPELTTLVCDGSKMADIQILEQAVAEGGSRLDVLYLNAGTAIFQPIESVTEASFDAQFNSNVKGHFFTLQRLMPYLADGASVIFTSSTVATAANLRSAIYSATKGAISKIAQVAANELAERKIRVNVVSPGPIATPGLEGIITPEIKNYLSSTIALKRMGEAEEIAKTVLFLASDSASFINGTEIVADGGYLNYALK